MVMVGERKVVNPLSVPQSDVHVSNRWERDVISHDMEALYQQYKDIRKHFYFPVSRRRISTNKNWIKEAQSLFPEMRSFTEEEADLHKKGIKRIFKSTGWNRHKDDR